MRARKSLFLLVGALAVPAFSAACSGEGRGALGPGAKKGNGATTERAADDPDASQPSLIDNARPDSGDEPGSEVCAPDPSRYEAPDNECDDDGDGSVDNVADACDSSLPVTGNAEMFARALGLCQKIPNAGDPKWGLISAKYTKGYNEQGAPAEGQHGILGTFGPLAAREGSALGVLSTGWGRVYDNDGSGQAAFKDGKGMQSLNLFGSKVPPGYPKASPGCPSIPYVHDVAVVRLEIKTPKNAKGFQFDFNFYSGEWPEYVCSEYNDGFIAYLKSAEFNGGTADNVSFDSQGAPVSVNNAFFDRCTPNASVGCKTNAGLQPTGTAACPGGEAELAGTGFEKRGDYCNGQSVGGGATGWLTSSAPVRGGETIVLEFYIWDSFDNAYNSSVLLDNFRWVPKPVVAATERPPK